MIPSAGNAGGAAAVYGARAGLPVAVVVPRATPRPRSPRRCSRAPTSSPSTGPSPPRARGGREDRAAHRLVRPRHAEGAVSPRGQEDDGARAGGAARLGDARHADLPDGGRHRPRRHLEGVRRAGRARVDQGRQPPSSPCRPRAARPWSRPGRDGARRTTMWENAVTDAPGLRVPGPFAGRQMLRDPARHGRPRPGGERAEIVDAQRLLARLEGIWTCARGRRERRRADPDEGRARGRPRTPASMMVLHRRGIKNPPPSDAARRSTWTGMLARRSVHRPASTAERSAASIDSPRSRPGSPVRAHAVMHYHRGARPIRGAPLESAVCR